MKRKPAIVVVRDRIARDYREKHVVWRNHGRNWFDCNRILADNNPDRVDLSRLELTEMVGYIRIDIPQQL